MPNAAIPSTAISPDKPPRRWRRLPLSLWMFLAIIVLLGLAAVATVGVPVYLHQSALRRVERLGGELVVMNGSSSRLIHRLHRLTQIKIALASRNP